jgi:hypothetical protein
MQWYAAKRSRALLTLNAAFFNSYSEVHHGTSNNPQAGPVPASSPRHREATGRPADSKVEIVQKEVDRAVSHAGKLAIEQKALLSTQIKTLELLSKYKENYDMGKWTKWIWGLIATFPLAVQAQIDLTVLDRDMVGPRAQVLVLGSIHLRYLPTSFNPASLDGVLNRLAAFKPDIITIEAQSGEECDLFARHPAKYGDPYNCTSTDAAKEATGLDVPAAIAEVNKTLKTWPAQPTAAQRRRLAAAFLAASDSASAYVQWLQLPEPERRTGDRLNGALVEQLERMVTRNSEQLQVAARLAARLGLQQVYATDNHTGDNIDIEDSKAFGRAMTEAWTAGRAELKKEEKQTEVLQ